MIELQDAHAALWERIHPLLLKNRLPHAFLFVGPRHAGMLAFANRLIALLLCQQAVSTPCGECRACHLLLGGIHPDINYIRQDTPGGAIKIEQIRELQLHIYQTPQRGSRRFIVIEAADKMNTGAANALLKVLEEPPLHTTFILIAEQMDGMPATILSRCQKYVFPTPELSADIRQVDYFMLGQFYAQESPRAELVKSSSSIISALCDLIEGKSSPCTLAAQWSSYAFDDLLWLLYLITAQAINDQLVGSVVESMGHEKLRYFSQLIQSVDLFNRLEQINAIMWKINHNINMNQTLVVEDLLLGYLADESVSSKD